MDIVDKLIINEWLPVNMVPEREIWEKLGFTFEETEDKNFYFARLPKGWFLSPNLIDESLSIIDDSGMFRGRINCSLECPNMKLYRRYDICIRVKRMDGCTTREVYHPTSGDVIFSSIMPDSMNNNLRQQIMSEESEKINDAKIYYDNFYPEWGSYFAYWDDDLEKESDDVLKSSEVYRKRVLK